MRNWACALEFNVELDLRQKSKELFPFHFPFHFSFLICHFKNFLICHLSFLKLCHFFFFFSVNESEIHA